MRSIQKVSSHIMWKIEAFIEEDTRHTNTLYIGQWCLKLGTLGPHILLPITIRGPVIFPESHWCFEISSLRKVVLVLGKARSCRAPNLGCRGSESPRWFEVSPKNSAADMMHEQVHCHDAAPNHQLPIAAGFWIIQIVSMEECSI